MVGVEKSVLSLKRIRLESVVDVQDPYYVASVKTGSPRRRLTVRSEVSRYKPTILGTV